MSESRRKKVLFAVLVVVVIFGALMKPWERPKRHIPNAASAAVPVAAARPETAQEFASIAPIKFVSEWPDDPFRINGIQRTSRSSTRKSHSDNMHLQGIMTVDGVTVSVINRQSYRIGASVNGWKIIGINVAGVRLQRAKETRQLRLR